MRMNEWMNEGSNIGSKQTKEEKKKQCHVVGWRTDVIESGHESPLSGRRTVLCGRCKTLRTVLCILRQKTRTKKNPKLLPLTRNLLFLSRILTPQKKGTNSSILLLILIQVIWVYVWIRVRGTAVPRDRNYIEFVAVLHAFFCLLVKCATILSSSLCKLQYSSKGTKVNSCL